MTSTASKPGRKPGPAPSKAFAKAFCTALSESDVSLDKLCQSNPTWPKKRTLHHWYSKFPWFKSQWDQARRNQADHLANKILDLHTLVTPKNAHQIRVQFDILRWITAKFDPAVFGDKPALSSPNTGSVHVQVNLVSPERIADLRQRLNLLRSQPKALPQSEPSRQIEFNNGAHTGLGTGTGTEPDLKLDTNPDIEKNGQK